MLNQATLKEKIRTIYFELISEASLYSYESLLAKMAKELNAILEALYTGLYLYDSSQNKYVEMNDETDGLKTPNFLVNINQYVDQRCGQQAASFTSGGVIFSADS